jgi:hypothetical protein
MQKRAMIFAVAVAMLLAGSPAWKAEARSTCGLPGVGTPTAVPATLGPAAGGGAAGAGPAGEADRRPPRGGLSRCLVPAHIAVQMPVLPKQAQMTYGAKVELFDQHPPPV